MTAFFPHRTATMSARPLENEINALTQKLQSDPVPLDPESRAQAIKAARELLHALTPPPERIIQDAVFNPALLMALRVGVDLDVFQTISNSLKQGATTRSIADKSGASFSVVGMYYSHVVRAFLLNQVHRSDSTTARFDGLHPRSRRADVQTLVLDYDHGRTRLWRDDPGMVRALPSILLLILAPFSPQFIPP
jgi:hypothetical protein